MVLENKLISNMKFLFTGWPRKNKAACFPPYVDAITGISVWCNFSWLKWYQDHQNLFTSSKFTHWTLPDHLENREEWGGMCWWWWWWWYVGRLWGLKARMWILTVVALWWRWRWRQWICGRGLCAWCNSVPRSDIWSDLNRSKTRCSIIGTSVIVIDRGLLC